MNRPTILTIFSLVLLSAGVISSQSLPDGTIFSRKPVLLDPAAPQAARDGLEGVILEHLIYTSDGLEVEGFLLRPEAAPETPLPAVIFNRGGNRDFFALNPERVASWLGWLAQRGYVVAASNYRGVGEHGRALYPPERRCAEGEPIGGLGREEFGGAEVNDVLSLIALLETLPEVDAGRLGIYGWSRGGMMTYLTLRASDRFKAAVISGGVADLGGVGQARQEMIDHVFSELIPGWDDPERRAAAIEARSAVRWPDELPASTPILLLQGTADWRVEPQQALDMASALQRARRPYRLVMLEGADHDLSEHQEEVRRLIGEWFDRYVRDGADPPKLEPHGE